MIKVIVFGTFDPLHEGHINLFQQAKELGDYFVVVVATDERIRTQKNREPRFNENKRVSAIKQNVLVDEVILGDKNNSFTMLDKIKPDIIAIGYDQTIPDSLRNRLDKYQVVILKPHKPEVYKSSKLH